MKWKSLLLALGLTFSLGTQAQTYQDDEYLDGGAGLFYETGEWPLPVRVVPFPMKDIVGGWDLGPKKPVMEISNPKKYPNGHFVDVKMIDKVTGNIIANGPGRVVGDVLVADDLQMGATKIYLQMVSLIPPKNSIEAKRNEKMVYVYILDKLDRSRHAQFRIRKINH